MENNTTDDKGDLLGQLAHLEQQVSLLSSELQARTDTIELLERSLNEKRLHISELEAALRVAQQSMLDLAWESILHYQQQIRSGVIRNLTDPKFDQLRKLIELIRSFPELARQYTEIRIIRPGHRFVQAAINNIDAIREDSASYYQNASSAIVSKYHAGLKQLYTFFTLIIEEAQNILDQKVLWPIKNVYEDIHETFHALPSEAGFLLRDRIGRPAWQLAGRLSVNYSKLEIESQKLIAVIRRSVQPLLSRWYEIITGKIKNFKDSHSFGTHDQGMTGTYA